MDKRVGELQLENVENISAKQSAEREVNSIKLKVEREQSEYKMEIERLQSEVGAVRARLKFPDDMLVKGRRQNLKMVEAVASLETDFVNQKHRRENTRKRKSNENNYWGSLEVTNKFEEPYNSWKREREIMKTEMTRLDSTVNDLSEQRDILETQNKEHGKLHEHLLNQIGYLEDTNKIQEDKLKRLSEEDKLSHITSSHSDFKIKSARRRRVSAITIESAGRVKSLMANIE